MVRQQAKNEKRNNYDLRDSMKALSYTVTPQALHAIQPTLAYYEKVRGMYNALDGIKKTNDRAKKVIDEYDVLVGKLDAALSEGKIGKAQRVVKQINKRAKEQKHLKQDFHRFRDDYAAAVNYWGIATGVLLPMTVIFGAWGLYQSMQSHGTDRDTTVTKEPYTPPSDHVLHVDKENGTIEMDGKVVATVDALKNTNLTFLYGAEKYQDHKKFLDDKYNATGLDGIQLTFHEDGSLHVEAKDKNAVVFNDLDAKQVHSSGIFQKLSGKDIYGHQINYTLLPVLKETAYKVDFHIDGKFSEDQAVKNVTVGMANMPTVMKVSADGDGVITAQLGLYDNEGNFTALSEKNLTEEQAKEVAYTIADNNPDADKPVDALFEKIAHNAESDAKNVYHTMVMKHNKFLKEYNFTSDEQVGEFINDSKNYTAAVEALEADHNCSKKNLSGFDDYIHGVEDAKNLKESFEQKWNMSIEKFDQFVKDLNNTYNNMSKNMQKAEKELNVSNFDDFYKELVGIKNAKQAADTLYKEFNVTGPDGIRGYITGLWDTINDTINEKNQMGAPFTVANITVDSNGTAAADLIRKQADRAGLDVFALDLTNESQRAVAKKVFGDSVVGRWMSEGIVKSFVIDGLDSGDFAAAIQQYDIDGLSYTTEVNKDTFASGVGLLKPYKQDLY